MNVTEVERIESVDPVELPEPWLPAWNEPDGDPQTEWEWSVVRVHTDAGVTGVGPATGDLAASDVDLVGADATTPGAFWTRHLSGARSGNRKGLAGVEIALWDAFGKTVGEPVHRLLGGVRDRVPAYAAISRTLPPGELVEQARDARAAGFQGAKLRLHRPDPSDDIAAVRAVRDAVGDDFDLYVDANQNNASPAYDFWSRATARRVAGELADLGVEFLEEPRPRRDADGLAEIRNAADVAVAGGEHAATVHDYRRSLERDAYDVLQPDVWMKGQMGITGLRRTAVVADFHDRTVVPHVIGDAHTALALAATLHAAGSVESIPLVEYPYDPPVLTPETLQPLAEDPITIDDDGQLDIPDGPGLGLSLDESELEGNGEVVWSTA